MRGKEQRDAKWLGQCYDVFMFADAALVSSLNALVAQSAVLSGLAIFFAQYFPYLLALLFLWFVIQKGVALKDKWLLVAEGFGAAVFARAGVEAVRLFIHRPRPFVDHAVTAFLSETSYSFPSGHTSFFFALSTVVFLYTRRIGWWFFAGSTLIGLARVAAGVHYPSDILGGALFGIVVGYATVKIRRWLFS